MTPLCNTIASRAVNQYTKSSLPSSLPASLSTNKITNTTHHLSTSSSNLENNFNIWKPNQLTTIYQAMEIKCPNLLKEYATCVINKQNEGALVQGACEEQFRMVMDCFKSVR